MMLRPAIAEEAGLFAIGAEAEIGYGADAGPRQPLRHIASEVEMRLARVFVGDEKGLAFRRLRQEMLHEVRSHLIGSLRNGGPDDGGDAFRLRPELSHG